MNKVLAVIVSLALTIFQLCVTHTFKIGWLNYNFALVCIVVVCCLYGGKCGIVNAVFVSFIYDIFASKIPGTYIYIYLAIALIVQIIAKHMFSRNIGASLIFVFVSTLVSELIVYWLFYAFNGMAYSAFALSKIILPQCIINSVICLIVFWFYKSVLKIKRS